MESSSSSSFFFVPLSHRLLQQQQHTTKDRACKLCAARAGWGESTPFLSHSGLDDVSAEVLDKLGQW